MDKQTPPTPESEKKEKWNPFRKKRAGVTLTKEEINEIKQKRKQLRIDLKKEGVTSKKDFELTASSLGYYFDRNSKGALLAWFFSGRVLPILLATTLSAVGVLYAISQLTQMHGFFTVNVTDELFKEGFSLKESFGDEYKSSVLNLGDVGVKEIPDSTITWLPTELEKQEGYHGLKKDQPRTQTNSYFAYSFYITNEGEESASLEYSLRFTNVRNGLDSALWFLLFVSDVDPEGNLTDTQLSFYAKANEKGESEVIPGGSKVAVESETYPFIGYYRSMLADPEQFVPTTSGNGLDGYKFAAKPFLSDTVICSGQKADLLPGYSQKYTLVAWIEGEDPDCTDQLIDGSAGLAMNFSLFQ